MDTNSTNTSSNSMSLDNVSAKYQEKYQTLMNEHFYSATTLQELKACHEVVKSKITREFLSEWSSIKPALAENSLTDFMSKLCNIADTTFIHLEKHFAKNKEREKNKHLAERAQQDALTFYDDEMKKFMETNVYAGVREISVHHKAIQERSLALADKIAATAMTAKLKDDIKQQILFRKVFYNDIVLMNKASLDDPVIGIDLGTTMCCVMIYINGKVELIPNRGQGNIHTTPSYVSYHEDGSETYGNVAKQEAYRYPETTIYDAKRILGRPWQDKKLQADRKKWPFEIINEMGNPKIKTFDRTRYPHEISAKMLTHLRKMAEAHLNLTNGKTIRKAVITVPAYFTEPQRRATIEAAMCAGMHVLNILNEPTAAAIAYNWHRRYDGKRTALIYDLGGGTFDVSIAELSNESINILGVDGDTHLGGQDFDHAIMQYCIDEYNRSDNIDLQKGLHAFSKIERDKAKTIQSRLKLQCEIVKERLSTAESSKVEVPYIVEGKCLCISISQTKLNELIKPFIDKTLKIVKRAIEAAKSKGIESKNSIDDIILVGGSTRIPLVIQSITEFFGKSPCQNINPDEAVAYGAAVQAAILNKSPGLKNYEVNDVTPMPLGIEVVGKKFSIVVPKNSTVPCVHSDIYVTVNDDQTRIRVVGYQGEKKKSTDNKWLGEFVLGGFPPKPAGEEKAEVTMEINEMGILTVKARSITTGKTNAITVTSDRLEVDKETIQRLQFENLFLA